MKPDLDKLNNHTKIIFFNKEHGKVGWNNVYSLRVSGNLTPDMERLLLTKGYFEIENPKSIEMYVLEKKIPVKNRKELFYTGDSTAYSKVLKLLESVCLPIQFKGE